MKPTKPFGAAVVDSYTPLKVKIVPQDIKGAICRDHELCVLAKALKRKYKAKWVDVGARVVLVSNPTGTVARRLFLNRIAQEQVRFFDTHDGRFAPCKVELKPPAPSYRLSTIRGRKTRHKPTGLHKKHRKPTR